MHGDEAHLRIEDVSACVCVGGAHSHACVRIHLIYLKTEGEEFGKDKETPPGTFAVVQLLMSFLWLPRPSRLLPPAQP